MIFVIADDRVLEVLSDIAAVRRECEPIDVQNGVYTFLDERGWRLLPRFTEPVETGRAVLGSITWVGGGQFDLEADREDDGTAFEAVLAAVVALSPNPWFSSVQDVARFIRDGRGDDSRQGR